MNDMQYRIEKISDYFREMQVTQVDGTNVIYVVVSFPPKWIIDDEVEEKYEVSVRDGREPGEYYFCAEISVGFDKVFDAIDHCIGINKDAMERAKIFQEKINELKEIFGNDTYTIAQLKSLDFVFPPQKKKAPAKKKGPVDEIVEKEISKEKEEYRGYIHQQMD